MLQRRHFYATYKVVKATTTTMRLSLYVSCAAPAACFLLHLLVLLLLAHFPLVFPPLTSRIFLLQAPVFWMWRYTNWVTRWAWDTRRTRMRSCFHGIRTTRLTANCPTMIAMAFKSCTGPRTRYGDHINLRPRRAQPQRRQQCDH